MLPNSYSSSVMETDTISKKRARPEKPLEQGKMKILWMHY